MVCEAAAELYVFSFPLTLKVLEFAFMCLLLKISFLSFLLFIKITLLEGFHVSYIDKQERNLSLVEN